MAFASATKAQQQAVRDKAINATKAVEVAVDTGPVASLGPNVDTAMAALVAAVQAAGTGVGGTVALVPDAKVLNVPITFTTARTAGQTATVNATVTVANGVITKLVIA